MFIKRSAGFLRSTLKFRGAIKQGFSTTKARLSYGKFPKAFMLCAALIPATMLYYCAEDNSIQVFETEANLSEGETKTIQVGPKEDDLLLIVKEGGTYYCLQNKCSHYGFPLSKGIALGGQVICPLHNATFDIKTGNVETGPVFDGLQTYKVEEIGGKLKIHVPRNKINTNKAPVLAKKENDNNPMVIIGGGPASEAAIEALRKAGHKGKIVLITKDNLPPYDRTALSKRFDCTKDNVGVRPAEFYKEYGIDLMLNSQVNSIDYTNKQVNLQNGKKVEYDKLLIASGCKNNPPASVPKIPGLKMLSLRSLDDFTHIKEAIEGLHDRVVKNITIVGGGFIGWEIASTLKSTYKNKIEVTIVDHSPVPFQKIFGSEVAKVLSKIASDNGIHYQSNTTIRGSEGNPEDNQVRNLVLTNKQTIPSDLIILGIGVQPVTNFVGDLTIDSNNKGIKTDAFLRTSHKDVFAAGDVASYPYWHTGEQIRVEHFNQAIYQGEVAALNMLGKKFPMDNIPFFWSRAFNQSIQHVGNPTGHDDVYIKGDLNKPQFVAYYLKNNKVIAASCMNQLNTIMIIREAMRAGVMASGTEVKNEAFNVKNLIEQIKIKKPVCKKCDLISNQL